MTLRRVNLVVLVLLAVAFLIVIQRNLLNLNDFLRKEAPDAVSGVVLPFESEVSPGVRQNSKRTGDEIPVVVTASEDRLGAVVAAINSIYQNSKANVVFNIVVLNDTVDHLKEWLSKTSLHKVKYKITVFKPDVLNGKISKDPKRLETLKPLTFARFYLPLYLPEAEKAIYLDDDVIVQGIQIETAISNVTNDPLTSTTRFLKSCDKCITTASDTQSLSSGDIKELYETSLKPGHAAAFSDDCDSASSKGIVHGAGNQNNYIGFLDFKKEAIKKLGMRAKTCSFNPGVIIANLTEWRNQNISSQLEHWMELNAKEDLYSNTLADSITTPPLLIVFYKHHSSIDPMWHVRHLGSTGAGKRYSAQFVKAAKLLHWNGHYKPWGLKSAYSDVWEKWYVPDPTGKFSPVRRHSGETQ
ncbi:Glycosyltransferase 8 domain-containing protein 1 [Merluccius polli]|uniref:Glycosyltransferase 8 domain-containing protein 1 n=1 Tax=Merluccius polli TaxID=89951 RepID=A0AA47MGF7_MERPO|nr:Glycosyltransferase 8 domain-containing protein 1 [Merluccius polli]